GGFTPGVDTTLGARPVFGSVLEPPAVAPGGPGTGHGTLNIVANEVVFGFPPGQIQPDEQSIPPLALGFSSVNVTGRERITASARGTLAVYERGTDAASYAGGDLNLITPLLTADSGTVFTYTAGGALTAPAPEGAAAADTSAIKTLGGELRLSAP